MKKNLTTLGIVLVLIILMALPYFLVKDRSENQTNENASEPAADSSAVLIEISDFKFSPSKITVKKGATVEWLNKDSVGHTATKDLGEVSGPESKILDEGARYRYIFNEAGSFNYHCVPHPFMKGIVEVIN